MKRQRLIPLAILTVSLSLLVASAQAQVSVSSTTPNSGEQGTISLDVTITGKGFKNGARAQWFVTATTNPGGVTVNRTTYVNSTTLVANITISDTAVLANYDIQVLNADGRTGKGTELFAVKAKTTGTVKYSMCTAPPLQTPISSCTAGSGCLDTSWGGTGMVVTNTDGNVPIASDYDGGTSVVLQPDGKVVAIGHTSDQVTYSVEGPAVVRYNPDGSIDTSFGVNGVATTNYGTGFGTTGGFLQPDGKIVVAGWQLGSGSANVVVRFNADGTLDQTFGVGGSAILTNMYQGAKAALQSDGRIALASGNNSTWTVSRLNTDGTIDTSFGSAGTVTLNFSKRNTPNELFAIAIQPVVVNGVTEERILVSGVLSGAAGIKRFTSTGAIDSTFGASGTATANFCGAYARAQALAVDSSGRILISGYMSQVSNGTPYAAIARFTPNGALDTTFGDASSSTGSIGMTGFNLLGGNTLVFGLSFDAQGRIVVTGRACTYASGGCGQGYPMLGRISSAGVIDTSFGNSGFVVTDVLNSGVGGGPGANVAIQPGDGKLVITGHIDFSSGAYAGTNFMTLRFWP